MSLFLTKLPGVLFDPGMQHEKDSRKNAHQITGTAQIGWR
jgi:hypothetical protein